MGIPHVDVLLFVGVAVAWAVYLIPKAIQHHEHAARTRSVERFSDRMRVLARREPRSARDAELIVGRAKVAAFASSSTAALGPSPAESLLGRDERDVARRAVRRRRRVLGVLLVSLAAVAGVAAYGVIEWWYLAIPGGLLVAWLVACRVMVKGERARRFTSSARPAAAGEAEQPVEPLATDETTEIARVVDGAPGMWDPVPVTLPTYVDKPAATRAVRSIELEAEGVWTSGRTDADTALARRADADAAAAREAARTAERDPGSDPDYGSQRAAGAAG